MLLIKAQNKIHGISKDVMISLYAIMSKIRQVELKIEEEYPKDQMQTPIHLCIGQEAIAAAVSVNLKKSDYVLSNHRGHGHYIAKGGNLNTMIAELYGRGTGCSKSRGGSMHLIDTDVGLLGSSSIVGGGIPIATGAALAIKMRKTKQVSVVFFGDAATEEGVFYESVNFAVLKKLPVIFVCENNFYSVCSHQSKRQAADNIYNRLAGCGIPGYRVNGCNVIEAYRVARICIENARKGEGPSLIECRAYRWRGHAGAGPDFDLNYRPRKELDEWMQNCPIKTWRYFLLKKAMVTEKKLDNIDMSIKREIEKAFDYAKRSPFSKKEEILKYLYH